MLKKRGRTLKGKRRVKKLTLNTFAKEPTGITKGAIGGRLVPGPGRPA